MIRYYLVEEERKRLNEEIQRIAPLIELEGVTGYGRSIKSILDMVIPAYRLAEGALKLKISGDGRRCGRRRKQVMMTLSVLSSGKISTSPDHHYTFSLWEGTEDYDVFQKSLRPFIVELEKLQKEGYGTNQGPLSTYLFRHLFCFHSNFSHKRSSRRPSLPFWGLEISGHRTGPH